MRLLLEQKLKELSVLAKKQQKNVQEIYACEICQDRGIYFINGEAVKCSCMKQKAINNRFKHADLGKQIQQFTFDKFNLKYYPHIQPPDAETQLTYHQIAQRTLKASKTFVADVLNNKPTKGILFCGPVGSGKTFLAASIANALITHGKEVLFAVVPDLLDEIRSAYFQQPEQGNNELLLTDAARKAEILILDDLGAHNYTEWTINKLYSIINYRVNNGLPLVVTTNLELAELEEKLGLRITSRLLQLCQVYRLLVENNIRYQMYAEQVTRKSC
ncbi:ATP-binding protein [Zhaonella formicivorans]|jgi:DNA replication protein DnaC|uniref:ATP-binding protein n=1 Tax=Zhaonella formicivorans TaxID=2528593 RepID=UPI001D0F7934|nr:ATP-binding protein [Zhaonella formicivorans]